jgi:hypothetical protein
MNNFDLQIAACMRFSKTKARLDGMSATYGYSLFRFDE